MKWRTPSVVARPRGEVLPLGKIGPTLPGLRTPPVRRPHRIVPPRRRVGSLVALAPPTYRRAIFSDFQLTAAIISAISFPAIVCVTAHPTLNEWKVGTPRGGAVLGGDRAHTAGSTDAASALAAPYRASAAPGGVPCGPRDSHIPACNLFRLPVNSRHNFRNILSCDSLCDGILHPKRMESKLPRPQTCVSRLFLKTRCHGFCGQGSSKPFMCAISRG